jgi:hypothetical protein
MYLLTGFEYTPKVLKPGKRVSKEIINELADELE